MPPNIVDDESSASTVAVREGLNTSLTCKAKGNPEPKILWRRENGLNITIDRRKKGKQVAITIFYQTQNLHKLLVYYFDTISNIVLNRQFYFNTSQNNLFVC